MESVFQTDLLGRTPLHVAITNHCSFEIVKLLLPAIEHTDAYGRTALHVAASLSPSRSGCSCLQSEQKQLLELVSLLYDAYPQAVSIPDEQGRCPWERAVSHAVQAFLRQEHQHILPPRVHLIKKKEDSHHDHTHPTEDIDEDSTYYSSCFVPHEIEWYDDDDDDYDLSTVGTGGVSRAPRRRPYQRFEL